MRIDPAEGAAARIFEVARAAIAPEGAIDDAAVEWESSGILDVSSLFALPGGSLFLADVQAHGIADQDLRGVTAGPAGL